MIRKAIAQSANRFLFQPKSIAWLVYLRIVLGITFFFHIGRYIYFNLIPVRYTLPPFHAKYSGFSWVEVPSTPLLYLIFYTLAACGVFITFGLFYRVASWLFFFGYSYVFLLDRAYYQNHDYLICLLSFLMALFPAGRALSLDVWANPSRALLQVPRWPLTLVRSQTALVYFYSGVAKFDRDWLLGDTASVLLAQRRDKLIGQLLDNSFGIHLLTFGGLFFDLFVVPLLLWKRTRAAAFTIAVTFHVLNSRLFDIGVFPWLAIALTAVFFPPETFERFFAATKSMVARPPREITPPAKESAVRKMSIAVFVFIYLGAQAMIPLRHFFLPGNPNWTHLGQTFSWRMMLASRQVRAHFFSVDGAQNLQFIDHSLYLSTHQIPRVLMVPQCVVQFARFVKQELSATTGKEAPEVHARILVSLNGRAPSLLMDPEVDLAGAQCERDFARCIMPLESMRDAPVP